MSHHINNKLEIHSNAEEILASLVGPEGVFDLNALLPMPPELNITKTAESSYAERYLRGEIDEVLRSSWAKARQLNTADALAEHFQSAGKELLEVGQQRLTNIAQFGYADGHDWCIANWGTHRNAYRVDEPEFENDAASICFVTAQSTPIPFLQSLSHRFPRTEFDMYFFGEAWNIAGHCYLHGGIQHWNEFVPRKDHGLSQAIYNEVYGVELERER
ncbi:MAG: hypothetical protein KDB27_16405 [Planctomycetales bacterium]|nr:hypothetical protein [Planctomycetales bacterium]